MAALTSSRSLARALLPLALHALAREVDGALGVLLHTTLDLPDFVLQALALVDPRGAALGVAGALLLGSCCWLALAWLERRRGGPSWSAALDGASYVFLPLLLRPAITLLALASLAARATYPYGFTLPVALTQDLGIAQDAAALAAALALWGWRPRLPAPRPSEVFFMAFLGYALLVPSWARHWEGHPGNEPKYLRMALALGHRLSLDVDGIDAPMEELAVEPLAAAAPRAALTLLSESRDMLRSLPGALAADAIRASRVARQTVRGKDGGVYHVLAPGPSLLLAPTLRLDRALNGLQGTPGRLGLTLLAWNAMGAALVAALFCLLRDATGRSGLSAALAGLFALWPPFLFYPFQFYPEMPGALVSALVLRRLLFDESWSERRLLAAGLLLASLPWLHQKFLPLWAVLVAMAVWMAVERLVTLRALLWLVLPQALSLFLTALYNFAITSCVRPDALFLAWGPAGVTSAHIGQGFLGLLLDARYGILPYVPLYLLAAGGALLATRGARRLRLALPAAFVYYLTVASADDWHGAVSNLGRYFMPIAPLVAAFAAVAIAATAARLGAIALVLALVGWSALFASSLWLDPHAANEAARLFERSAIADGAVYVPDLFIRTFAEGAPGLFAQLACWGALALALAIYVRRAASGRSGSSPLAALAGSTVLLLACGFLLERWPSGHGAARFPNALELRPGTVAFVTGPAAVEQGVLRARQGELELLVRSRAELPQLNLSVQGRGQVSISRTPPIEATPAGAGRALPLQTVARLTGRRGVQETLYRQRLRIRAEEPLTLRLGIPAP